jgi:hypothetical protein
MRARFWRGSVFFLLMLTASLASFAQVDTARLQGTVTDPQGAAAVGATVLITSVQTGRANSTTTNDLGFYSASALPPGRYRIEVTQPGFKKISRELELQIAQVGVADFRLDVGDVTQPSPSKPVRRSSIQRTQQLATSWKAARAPTAPTSINAHSGRCVKSTSQIEFRKLRV